jgi:diguanylate cyclase (GGDEF)-like protein
MSKLEVLDAGTVGTLLAELMDTTPLSVAVVDIDEFGAINETRGRAVGDEVIAAVGTVLSAEAGSHLVARTGGDEFICAFPGESPEQALLRLEAVRRRWCLSPAITHGHSWRD